MGACKNTMIGGDTFERVIANLQAQVDELEYENSALESQLAIGQGIQENGQSTRVLES